MPKTANTAPSSEASIFARHWEGEAMTQELARHVLKLRFLKSDEICVHELANGNREGRLTEADAQELDNYVKVGDLLAILQSKARVFLCDLPVADNGHG
jgi:hypothetical protein